MLVYQKFGKRSIDLIFSFLGLLIIWPFLLFIGLLIKIDSFGPVIFKQKRIGKNGQIFILYKLRTMIHNAEKLKEKYQKLNEADGPVFKIDNDPRFTKIGKFLSHTGFDEITQLLNILKGEMSFIGPRPLPIKEEAKINSKYRLKRQKALPGLVSSWLIKGAHKLSFEQWMNFDLKDIRETGFIYDMKIIFKTFFLVLKYTKKEIKKSFK